MNKIFVLGSFMTDLVATMDVFPKQGETLSGNTFHIYLGGKGANQYYSLVRLGSDAIISGKLGDDSFGKNFLDFFDQNNLDSSLIYKSLDTSSGVGHIQINKNGDNRIVVILGSNLKYDMKDLENSKKEMLKCKYLLCQMEMDLDMTFEAIKFAKNNGLITMLNPAPANKIKEDYYQYIDYLTPNEHELSILTSMPTSTIDEIKLAAKALLDKGIKHIVVTIGKKGCLFVDNNHEILVGSYNVDAIDTVAAGDSFNAALITGLAREYDLITTLKYANAMGGLTTTIKGAFPSLHTHDEVRQLMKEQDVDVIIYKE